MSKCPGKNWVEEGLGTLKYGEKLAALTDRQAVVEHAPVLTLDKTTLCTSRSLTKKVHRKFTFRHERFRWDRFAHLVATVYYC